MSFEGGKDLDGWREASILVTDKAILQEIEVWFNQLWQQSCRITSDQIKKTQEYWHERRNNRPLIIKGSLLTALKQNPDEFKDRKIMIAMYKVDLSEEALSVLDDWTKAAKHFAFTSRVLRKLGRFTSQYLGN